MARSCSLVLTLFLCLSPAALAQPTDEIVLLPTIVARNTTIPGAFGSLWKTTTEIVNDSDSSFEIGLPWHGIEPDRVRVPAHSTTQLDVALTGPLIVRIPLAVADDVAFQTRVHDASRATTNFGTRIPSVREREFRRTRTIIADVPTADPFRATLRIYAPKSGRIQFRVTLLTQPKPVLVPDAPAQPQPSPTVLAQFEAIASRPLDLQDFGYSVPVAEVLLPGSGSDPVQVMIEPVHEGASRFYAFISVTNNETQHVTILSPR